MEPLKVFNYLMGHGYPDGATQDVKRSIRRAAKKNYKLGEDQQLLYKVNRRVDEIIESDEEEAGPSWATFYHSPWRKVPLTKKERTDIVTKLHSKGGHLGMSKTIKTIQRKYYWPNMTVEIKQFIKTCHICQQMNRKCKATAPPMVPVPVAHARPWHQIGIDLVSMVTSEQGSKYMCTIVCYFTKYSTVRALKTNTASEVCAVLVVWMMIFGFPGVIISDQGREFCNKLTEELFKATGTEHRVTSAYHPQSNGMTERFNQTIQLMISKHLEEHEREDEEWESVVQQMVFAYNTSVHTSTKFTPYFLMFGVEPTLSGDLQDMPESAKTAMEDDLPVDSRIEALIEVNRMVRPHAMDNIKEAQQKQKQYYDKRHENETYEIGQKVMKKNMRKADRKGGKRDKRFIGPYTIRGPGKTEGTLLLKDVKGKELVKAVHAMNLKAYEERNDTEASGSASARGGDD